MGSDVGRQSSPTNHAKHAQQRERERATVQFVLRVGQHWEPMPEKCAKCAKCQVFFRRCVTDRCAARAHGSAGLAVACGPLPAAAPPRRAPRGHFQSSMLCKRSESDFQRVVCGVSIPKIVLNSIFGIDTPHTTFVLKFIQHVRPRRREHNTVEPHFPSVIPPLSSA